MRVPKGGVAFFDSGIGGLTVLAECRKALPNTIFYYYGDNGNAPYGNLAAKKITRLVFRAFKKIARYRPVAAVIACNTATAVCVERVRRRFSFPIVGAEPAVRLAARAGGETFVLSTRATYESSRFQALCRRVEKEFGSVVKAYPCDGLAGAIEEGLKRGKRDFSSHFPTGKPDAVVLGCTHYVYIKREIETFYGCAVFDGNGGIAKRLKNELEGRVAEADERYDEGKRRKSQAVTRRSRVKKTEKTRKNRLERKKRKNADHSQPPSVIEGKKRGNTGAVYFVGGYKILNKSIYEQMFALKTGK